MPNYRQKITIIFNCTDCEHFVDATTCDVLEQPIPKIKDVFPIPEWCPLPTAGQKAKSKKKPQQDCPLCVWARVPGVRCLYNAYTCQGFHDLDEKIAVLKKAVQGLAVPPEQNWLARLSPSQAFCACMGAGPWEVARRREVQEKALKSLGERDLRDIETPVSWYPLAWQNNMTDKMSTWLKTNNITMTLFIEGFKTRTPRQIKNTLGEVFGCHRKHLVKTVRVFIRDVIQIPEFPIDRWVLRWIRVNGFVKNSEFMVALCKQADLDPNDVNRRIFYTFADNPEELGENDS